MGHVCTPYSGTGLSTSLGTLNSVNSHPERWLSLNTIWNFKLCPLHDSPPLIGSESVLLPYKYSTNGPKSRNCARVFTHFSSVIYLKTRFSYENCMHSFNMCVGLKTRRFVCISEHTNCQSKAVELRIEPLTSLRYNPTGHALPEIAHTYSNTVLGSGRNATVNPSSSWWILTRSDGNNCVETERDCYC